MPWETTRYLWFRLSIFQITKNTIWRSQVKCLCIRRSGVKIYTRMCRSLIWQTLSRHGNCRMQGDKFCIRHIPSGSGRMRGQRSDSLWVRHFTRPRRRNGSLEALQMGCWWLGSILKMSVQHLSRITKSLIILRRPIHPATPTSKPPQRAQWTTLAAATSITPPYLTPKTSSLSIIYWSNNLTDWTLTS